MKLSAFMVAFIISTAVHVGALASNLLHVNAETIPDSRIRTVKLHIVPAAVPEPAMPLPEPVGEKIEKKRTMDSEIRSRNQTEPVENLRQDKPAPNHSEIALSEEHPVAEKPSPVRLPAYREKSTVPDHPSEIIPDPPPAVTAHSFEQLHEAWVAASRPVVPAVPGSGDDVCGDCSASLIAASSLVSARAETGVGEIGSASPAMITLPSKPTYPRYSRLHKEEGTTVLSVEILPDGTLGSVEVVRSSGYRRLDRAAVEGMEEAELVAAVKDGRKVASVKRISIRFDLEDWGE